MSGPPRRTKVGYDVTVVLPGIDRVVGESLWEALHTPHRKVGIIHHNRDPVALTFLTWEADEPAARAYAHTLLAEAARRTGLMPELLERVEIVEVIRRERNVTGRPRLVDAPAGHYRTVDIGERGELVAMHEGGLGEWVAHLQTDRSRAVAGRDLLAVLTALLELPSGRKEAWVYEVIATLAGRGTPLGVRYPCPCCDFLTLTEPPSGSHATCPVCWWEDDLVQFEDPDYPGGANRPSLREARANVERIGAVDERYLKSSRPPLPEERP